MLAVLCTSPARAFDPLLAERSLPATPAAGFAPVMAMCESSPLGMPLTLGEAVSRTLCRNPKTREAWANEKAQAAAVGQARAAYLPTVSANWQGVRDSSREDVQNYPNLSSDTTATIRSMTVTLNWLLYDFGGRKAALRGADDLLAAARATHNATLQDEFATVAKDYDAAQAAQGALDAAREIERMTGNSMTAARTRVERGVAPLSDALQAQTQHEQAVSNVMKADGDLQTALGILASDMGLDPDVPLTVPPVSAPPTVDDGDEPVAALIDQVKRMHPAVLAAEAQYEAAQEKVAQTRAGSLPSVSLVGRYSRNNQPASLGLGIPTFPATGRDTYIGVQISIPLFEGFNRHYGVHQAQAQVQYQQAVLDGTREQVALDVWNAWQGVRTAKGSVVQDEKLLGIARQAFEAASHRYRAGVGSILEVLSTQAALASAQQRQVQALSDWHSQRWLLASKLGRLDMDDIARDVPVGAQ
ncbi:TolC family protein [Paraburkholderia ginsengisoli]|uniref:Protein CyaE n=1 Tax=Paraburkholderia ginsengisoli TaxID=311231 RepID=A0A7T4NA17_9BURK|nr:TolC family protein [Paraburkholderia ginsengisoli]QQC67996.1 TolC family protein [Paraburkholderia ginsengisoli]